MVAWEIKNMGGVLPRMDARLIPDNMAVEVVNCDLTSGNLIGLPHSEFLIDLSAALPVVERAFRFPKPLGDPVDLQPPALLSGSSVVVSGSGIVEDFLTSTQGEWSGKPTTISIAWMRDDGGLVKGNGYYYYVNGADVGHHIYSRITAVNEFGSTTVDSINSILCLALPIPSTPPVATAPPQITGSGVVGDGSLKCSTGYWANSPTSYTGRWLRDGVEIGTGFEYFVQTVDVGHNIVCEVTAVNQFGSASQLSNSILILSAPPTGNPPVNVNPPTVSGTGQVGSYLYSTLGDWTNSPTSYLCEWWNDTPGMVVGTGLDYLIQLTDANHNLTSRVTATNAIGSTLQFSNDKVLVSPPPPPPPPLPVPGAVTPPQVTGSGYVGDGSLKCSLGDWTNSPTSYTGRWLRDGTVTVGAGFEYFVQGVDIGHTIVCEVTAANGYGSGVQLSNSIFIPGLLRVQPLAGRTTPEDDLGVVAWLPLPSRFSSVERSPLTNDVYGRIYWTNPGDISPHVTTWGRLKEGLPYFDLGIIAPVSSPVVSGTMGGTLPPDVLPIDRSYVYTYYNSFNEESAPSPASAVYSGPPDATWTVINLPQGAPANPDGRNYLPILGFNLYRTITSAGAGAQFYFVTKISFLDVGAAGGFFYDTLPDSAVVMSEVLETTGYRNPPDYLDGLTTMPGGFMVGFTGNTVHFSEPDRPYAWPDIYDLSANFRVIALAVWQQSLMVLTQGFPSVGSGNMPGNVQLVQTQVAEPCISRGSVVVDTSGVYYASQNGLIQLTPYGMQNITQPILEKNEWLLRYRAKDLVSARHRSQFMSVNGTDLGFLVDYAEQRLAFQDLSYLKGVVCVWNDEFSGDTLICASGRIYEWDCPTEGSQVYRWKSKQFFTPMPISLGAVQIDLDPQVLTPPPVESEPLDNGDPNMDLPAGINAVFRYYAGPRLALIMIRNLTKQQEIFRLPSGFKCFDHQVEILARVPITSIQLSTTLGELKKT